MPVNYDSPLPSDALPQDAWDTYASYIVGAAIFDLNGLPKEYFVTNESNNISWVQTIFQALGLRSLLMASLQLEGFHHAVIYGVDYSAIVVKQPSQYTALLIRKTSPSVVTPPFIRWVQEFESDWLRSNSRFHAA